MISKTIKANSTEAIAQEIERVTSESFKPTLAIVFLSIKQDWKKISQVLDQKEIAVFGATTSGEFIDGDIEEDSIVMMLLDLNPEHFRVLFLETGEHTTHENAMQIGIAGKNTFNNPAFIIASGWLHIDGEKIIEGIIEGFGEVKKLIHENENLHITMDSHLTPELKIDQSVAHNGVCLTVVNIENDTYTVTAIKETLAKSNLGELKIGDKVNLERAMLLGERLDGHIVQGHVDQTAICTNVEEQDGSWMYTFKYDPSAENITIEKGSITINGVSLTVVDSKRNEFKVAIIPYTYENTNFHEFKIGTKVNLEFDVIGKYVARLLEIRS